MGGQFYRIPYSPNFSCRYFVQALINMIHIVLHLPCVVSGKLTCVFWMFQETLNPVIRTLTWRPTWIAYDPETYHMFHSRGVPMLIQSRPRDKPGPWPRVPQPQKRKPWYDGTCLLGPKNKADPTVHCIYMTLLFNRCLSTEEAQLTGPCRLIKRLPTDPVIIQTEVAAARTTWSWMDSILQPIDVVLPNGMNITVTWHFGDPEV